MNQYTILLGYFDKQLQLIMHLYEEVVKIDVSVYDKRYTFSLKTQQLYTALEDLFKQIAKAFENHIERLEIFHKELLNRMNTEMPNMRPAVISVKSLLLLDKVRAFRHFIRHAYDCELDVEELQLIQQKLQNEFSYVMEDLNKFRLFLLDLVES